MSRPSLSVLSRLAFLVATSLIFSTLTFGQAEIIVHDFIALPHGGTPVAPLVGDAAGNVYGTTQRGGMYSYGTVFKLSPGSNGKWTETVLYNFTNGLDGGYPGAGVIFDGAGNLYGTTTIGGASCIPYCYGNAGTVFELSPNSSGTWTETTLHSFGATANGDGSQPLSGVIFDKAGNLYGTTQYGGSGGYGTVFELSPSQGVWNESILVNFSDEGDGGYPLAGVTLDSAGNLYGTASVGGDVSCNNYGEQPWGCGLVFKLTNSSGVWSETVLHSFVIYDGATPNGNLIFDNSGDLIGTTFNGPGQACGFGCGTVFELIPGSGGTWSFKSVYTFAGGLDSARPESGLILGADGNFYGTASSGGDANNCQYGCGTVFSLTPTKSIVWKEKIIHHFSGSTANPYGLDGAAPYASLIFDQSGNLYGTTRSGGASGQICNDCSGTVFKMSKNAAGQWATSQLYAFVASGDGLNSTNGYLLGTPISDAFGNLYGSAAYGGAYGYGAVYQLIPQTSGGYTEKIIYSFRNKGDGQIPHAGLVADPAGNLYGLTAFGGSSAQCNYAYGCGVIFELSPANNGKWTEQTLYNFGGVGSLSPNGPLVIDSHGNLFGSTAGYNGNSSIAFELSPSGSIWTFNVIHTFTSPDTFSATGPYTMDSSGNLFGVGDGGGRGAGVVYELSPGTSGYTVSTLYSFAGGADGLYPAGQLIDKNGVIIGVTYNGGSTNCSYGCGLVFALAHSGTKWNKRTLLTFAGGTDVAYPQSGLTADSSGNLYGTSWGGGSAAGGTVFKLTSSGGTWTDTVLNSFGLLPHDVFQMGSLLWTPSNQLFGNGFGGDDDNGAIFEIDLNQASKSLTPPPLYLRAHPPQGQPLIPASPYLNLTNSGKGGR